MTEKVMSEADKKNLKILKWFFIAGMSFLFVTCGAILVMPTSDEPTEIDAFVMCNQFMEPNLKAPKTAEFAKYSERRNSQDVMVLMTEKGPLVWKFNVRSYVDSENTFGAKIRTKFICELRKDKDKKNWILERIRNS